MTENQCNLHTIGVILPFVHNKTNLIQEDDLGSTGCNGVKFDWGRTLICPNFL